MHGRSKREQSPEYPSLINEQQTLFRISYSEDTSLSFYLPVESPAVNKLYLMNRQLWFVDAI